MNIAAPSVFPSRAERRDCVSCLLRVLGSHSVPGTNMVYKNYLTIDSKYIEHRSPWSQKTLQIKLQLLQWANITNLPIAVNFGPERCSRWILVLFPLCHLWTVGNLKFCLRDRVHQKGSCEQGTPAVAVWLFPRGIGSPNAKAQLKITHHLCGML